MKAVPLLLAIGLCAAAIAAADPISLTRNGQSKYAIATGDSASPAITHGALELAQYIKEISGAELPVVPRAATGPVIRLVQDSGLANEQYQIATEGRDIVIRGGGSRGVLYGCYALLEDALGVRWFNTRFTRVPHRPSITLANLHLQGRPAFEYREPYYSEAFDGDWAARNRCNGNGQRLDEKHGGRVQYSHFVHTFNSLVPPETYYDRHPEYFSMVNGVRLKGYHQLCLTNPDVLRISIEQVKQWIAEAPDATIFSVSQNDTAYRCECPNCKAVEKEEGAASGVVLRFVNAIADAIAKDHPNVLIDTLAYQWTETPPLHVRPRPNVRIRLAPISACVAHPLDGCDANRKPLANLEAWGKITDQLYIWHYSTNFANYLQPLPDLDEIPADIALFKKNGTVGIFYEGDYATGGGGEMSELKAYLMAKLLWDPTRPAKPIISEYVQGVYGKAAPYIQRWLDALHEPERKHNVHARIYDPPTAAYLSDDLLQTGDRLFDAAEKAVANDERALDEVKRARVALQYVEFARSKPAYTVNGERYLPQTSSLPVTEAGMADLLTRYGITMMREWEPAADTLKKMRREWPQYPAATLQTDALALTVVPALGGRAVALTDRRTGRNLLFQAPSTAEGYPNAGGYEEYSTAAYRSEGVAEAFNVVSSTVNTLEMNARLATGIEMARRYALDGSTLTITTTLRNTADKPVAVAPRAHPEFAVPPRSGATLSYTDIAGKRVSRSLRAPMEQTFAGTDRPAGKWRLSVGSIAITQEFDPEQVDKTLCDAGNGRANLELFGKARTLQPGETATFQQRWVVAIR